MTRLIDLMNLTVPNNPHDHRADHYAQGREQRPLASFDTFAFEWRDGYAGTLSVGWRWPQTVKPTKTRPKVTVSWRPALRWELTRPCDRWTECHSGWDGDIRAEATAEAKALIVALDDAFKLDWCLRHRTYKYRLVRGIVVGVDAYLIEFMQRPTTIARIEALASPGDVPAHK